MQNKGLRGSWPTGGTVFFSVNDHDKSAAVDLARRYVELGFQIVATEGTANVLEKSGLIVGRVFRVAENAGRGDLRQCVSINAKVVENIANEL